MVLNENIEQHTIRNLTKKIKLLPMVVTIEIDTDKIVLFFGKIEEQV